MQTYALSPIHGRIGSWSLPVGTVQRGSGQGVLRGKETVKKKPPVSE